jgi:hypothetical protein
MPFASSRSSPARAARPGADVRWDWMIMGYDLRYNLVNDDGIELVVRGESPLRVGWD